MVMVQTLARQRGQSSLQRRELAKSSFVDGAPRAAEHPLLTLQRAIGNQAVQRVPKPKQPPSGPRGKDDQEQSWLNPMKAEPTGLALVATIYFRTKEFATDSRDESVLLQLAKAYAPWAERNRGKKDGELGLRGRIVGYADPRSSVEPTNQQLSAKRADFVEHRLRRALVKETALIDGKFLLEKKAGGVAPADPDAKKGAEEVSLGWQRRAEVYLEGYEMAPKPPERRDPEPEPDPSKEEKPSDDLDRFLPYVRRCLPEYAKGTAMRILGYLSVSGIYKAFKYTGSVPILVPVPGVGTPKPARGIGTSKGAPAGQITYGNHGGTLPFQPKKPPWWDNRRSGYDGDDKYLHRRRRPAETKCEAMLRETMMLVRDMRDVNKYIDLTVDNANSAYLKFMAELRKSAPDVAKLREYAVPIEYLMFMWEATADKARDVSRIADQVEGK
jgi:outer membrane protein OmpA-like peptidoglycan-associated protein